MPDHDPSLPTTAEDWMGLLPAEGVGCVSTSIRALPVVMPVRYRQTTAGIELSDLPVELSAALTESIVCFEAHSLDAPGAGWSVNVVGKVEKAKPGDGLVIPLHLVTGRSFADGAGGALGADGASHAAGTDAAGAPDAPAGTTPV